jgi:hypothetical protein
MTISEKTRLARVGRWTSLKNAWKAKLSKATTQNDTDVANKMIAEGILESKGEAPAYDEVYGTPSRGTATKKVKVDNAKTDKEISNKAKEGTNIGL